MDNVEHDAMSPDPLQAWQQALAEVPQTAALVGAQRGDLFGRFVEWYGRLRSRPRAERRRLQRRLGMSLAGVALLLAVNGAAIGIASPTATITVTGACDLIEAIENANDTTTGQPNLDCGAGDPAGADTIDLQVDVSLTAVHNTTQGNNGLPVVTSPITIEGNGHTVSRQGGSPDFRIMFVSGGGNLTLNSATISGGVASGTFPSNRGGGVYFGSGSSGTVSNSTFSGNSAYSGGGIGARYATVTVANSTLSGNSVTRSGGGIEVVIGRTMITNSTLSDNSAGFYGGGIMAFSGTVTVANSTISGNRADTGGGIRGDSTKMTVQNSTLSGNSAGFGGGMAFRSATAVVQNSTVSGNSASIGGGIGGDFSTVTVQNSIVAAQSAGYDCGIFSGTIPSAGYNIESGTSCGFAGTGDQQNVSGGSLNLGALGNNGGPTQTMALGPGSVAIDQIPVSVNGCVAGVSTDQRGAPRAGGTPTTGGPACDVGAYEYASTPLAVALASFDAQSDVDHILLTWETVSELNNSGFNLYRSTSPAAPDELLAFVPSQAPGSTVGASYSFDDDQVAPGQTWHYWLEDVDLNGATTLHGPVSATIQVPTAVTLDALDAQAASPAGGLSAWSALLAAVIGMAGALAARRRSGFR